jgi:hypothetical protein
MLEPSSNIHAFVIDFLPSSVQSHVYYSKPIMSKFRQLISMFQPDTLPGFTQAISLVCPPCRPCRY